MEDFETIELTIEELDSIENVNPDVNPHVGKQIKKLFDGYWIVLTYTVDNKDGTFEIKRNKVKIK